MNFPWHSVDWSRSDISIAGRFGCTREAVRQARKRLNAPRANRQTIAQEVSIPRATKAPERYRPDVAAIIRPGSPAREEARWLIASIP